jgi:nucleoside-diphosphate-sugar epimerase
MTVLVTGAAGFLGSHVIEALLERGEEPRALIRPDDDAGRLDAANVDIRRADIADPAALKPALKGVDRVVHCAARTGPWGPEHEYMRTNVRGLELLVRAAGDASVDRVVHVSSITVHGNDVGGWADEDSPLRAEPNPYSRSKLAGERLLERMVDQVGVTVTVVRPGWIYGPRDAASFGRLARAVEEGHMFLVGSGDNHLPLIYVRDAANGLLLASEAPSANGRAYVLVNDERVTQRQFLGAVASELGVPAPARHVPYALVLRLGAVSESLGRLIHRRQPPPVMRYGLQLLGGENRFAIARARQELGFTPAVDFRDGVRRSVSWYRDPLGAGNPPAVPA